MRVRVNTRRIPRDLAGIAVTRDTLERIKRRIEAALPPRPMDHVLSDLLAHAYMVGVIDAVRGADLLDGATASTTSASGNEQVAAEVEDHRSREAIDPSAQGTES